MKIKLIVAPQTNPDPYWKPLPPLGIATITSYLKKKGHYVDQDDLDVKAIHADRTIQTPSLKINLAPFREIEKVRDYLLKKKQYPYLDAMVNRLLSWTNYKDFDVVAISIGTRAHQLMPAMCLAKKIKEETNSVVVIGGRRIYPEILKEYPFVDYGILMDNGENFEKLLRVIEGDSRVIKENIPNLMYRKENDVHIGPTYDFDMQAISYPDYSGLPLELYKYYPYQELDGSFPKEDILILPYYAVEGCVGRCAFCSGHAGKLGMKSPKKISKEIVRMKKDTGTNKFMLVSNEININYDFMKKISEALAPHKILWTDSARLDNFDKDLMKKTAESGCIQLTYGLESGSQELLERMQKDINLKKAAKILKWGYKAGIWSHVNVIAGLPYETDEDINKTIGFLNKNSPYINSLTVTKFYVAYNSPIEKFPEKFGLRLRQETQLRFSNVKFESFVFDEANGLKWEEKQLQQEECVQLIDKGYAKRARAVVPIPTLFYLYSVIGRNIRKIEETVQKFNLLKPYGMYG